MKFLNISRRKVLAAPALILPSVFPLSSCVSEKPESDAKQRVLERFVNLLFPIRGVEQSTFTEIAKALCDNGDLKDPIEAGVKALNGAADENWLNAEEAAQLRVMKSLEIQPWFLTLLIMSRAMLFDRPEVWGILGFEGSSIEEGGYINRGFNDIDWLPEVTP